MLVQQRDVRRHRLVGRDLRVRIGRARRSLRHLVQIELPVRVPGSARPTIHAVRLKFWFEFERFVCDAGTKPSDTVKTCLSGSVPGSEYTWYCGAMRAGVVETS